jgi:hypothetical protein
MATPENHENHQLASRLVAAADGIVLTGATRLERDLRAAAKLIRGIGRPAREIPGLVSGLAKIANSTSDVDTQRRLRRLLGETP